MVLYAYLRRAFPCLSHSPPTVAYAPQSGVMVIPAPPGQSLHACRRWRVVVSDWVMIKNEGRAFWGLSSRVMGGGGKRVCSVALRCLPLLVCYFRRVAGSRFLLSMSLK